MRKVTVSTLVLMLALLLSVTAFAQDVTPMPGQQVQADVSDIVANAENYYGSTVTLEGNIIELVNVKAFILDDGALLATNQVIVINNTDYEYPLWVTADNRVRVTGIVHPRVNDGGMDALLGGMGMMQPTDPMLEGTPADPLLQATPDPMMEGTPTDPMMESTPDLLMPMDGQRMFVNPLSAEVVPERFYDWVIIEVINIEDLTHLLQ